MDQETLWKQFTSLPREAQLAVSDFIAFLQAKYASPSGKEPVSSDLRDDPFVGIWHDRTEMSASDEWVRALRKQEWHDR